MVVGCKIYVNPSLRLRDPKGKKGKNNKICVMKGYGENLYRHCE